MRGFLDWSRLHARHSSLASASLRKTSRSASPNFSRGKIFRQVSQSRCLASFLHRKASCWHRMHCKSWPRAMQLSHKSPIFVKVLKARKGFLTSSPSALSVHVRHGRSISAGHWVFVLPSAFCVSASFHAFFNSLPDKVPRSACINKLGPCSSPCLKSSGLYGCTINNLS